ncbi:MAG: TusE/DsrC/DsvC family sulfur relay protein [Paracoccaceae bacterium]
MSFDFDGTTYETTANGHLEDQEAWSEDLGRALAAADDLELTDRHWDLIKFLRSEFFDNRENQPNTRKIGKAMGDIWGDKPSSKDLYDLFPGDPSKQGSKIAGLPESRRKGGY